MLASTAGKSFGKVLIGSFLLLTFLSTFQSIGSNDFWWHLKLGEIIWLEKAIPYQDIFSHTAAGNMGPTHGWGSSLVFYGLYELGGLAAVRVFVAYLLSFALFLFLRQVSWKKNCSLAFLLGLLTFHFFLYRAAPRPSLLSLWFATLLPFLWNGLKDGIQPRKAFFVSLFFLVWFNLHAEALIGMVLTILYLAFYGFQNRDRWKAVVGFSVVLVLVSLLQPSGVGLYAYVFKDTTVSMQRIHEWRPTVSALWNTERWVTLLSILFVGLSFFFVLFRKRRNTSLLSVLTLSGVSIVIALSAIREIYWFVIPLVLLGGELIDDSFLLRKKRWIAPLAVFFLGLSIPWADLRPSAWVEDVAVHRFPIAQVEFMKEAKLEGNLFNFYDNGGYVLYHLYPRVKVFIDSRHSPYPEQVHQDHHRILYGEGDAASLLEQYKVDLLLIRSSYFQDRSWKEDWFRAFSDGYYAVYIRKNDRNAENIRRAKNLRKDLRN